VQESWSNPRTTSQRLSPEPAAYDSVAEPFDLAAIEILSAVKEEREKL
jgi:hypothetical protein